MNHKRSIIAAAALAAGLATLATSEASAQVPEDGEAPRPAAIMPHDPVPPNDVSSGLPAETSTTGTGQDDDTGVEVLQAGASALGGAGIAVAGMLLYRRRQVHAH